MKGIILAAGRGSRMKEATEALPKCLVELWGKSLLDWQLQAIRKAGIEEIAVVTGYKAEKIRERHPELTYFHNEDWEKTNMVATLMKARTWLTSDTCIISYSDIIYDTRAVKLLANEKMDIAITYYTKFMELWEKRFQDPLEDLETFRLDEQSNLTEIGHRPTNSNEVQGQYMGLLRFTPEGWQRIYQRLQENLSDKVQKLDMTGLLSYMIEKQTVIKAIPYDGVWLEVDNGNDLALYETWKERYRF